MNDDLMLQTECTLFFEENPYTFETVAGLATRLGRKEEHIQPVLDLLVRLSILSQLGTEGRAIYHYNQPDTMVLGGM